MNVQRVLLVPAAAAILAAVFVWAAESPAPAGKAAAAKAGGKELFLTYKCTSCHSIEAEKIEKKKSAEATEGEAASDATASAKKNPDLSGVGAKKDAAWISKYLMKEEKLEDKLHKTKFKGTPEELQALSAWLAALKTPAKKTP